MITLGFIGTGNMGSALARAAARQADCRLLLANRTPAKAEALALETGGTAVTNEQAAREADFLFLGVKPQMMQALVSSLAGTLRARTGRFVLVTMAAGLTMQQIEQMAGGSCPVIRIMPNTPAAVGAGMITYCANAAVTPQEMEQFLAAMSGAGRFLLLPEPQIDAASAVAGCGPAFVDLFLEALADGGVACGLPRAAAMELAAQMTFGAAKLALASGQHPAQLKDAVCSPGGTTIQGGRALEAGGFRSAVIEAVIAAYEKNQTL